MSNSTRRDFLKVAAASAAGLGLAPSAPAVPRQTRARSLIFINMIGGPSQLDTFDPKPEAASDIRGPFSTIATRTPGVRFTELFPKLAAMSDSFSLIRSMHHDAPPIHESGLQLLNTGRLFRDGPEWPSIGAVLAHAHTRGSSLGTQSNWWILPDDRLETGIQVSRGLSQGWLCGRQSFPRFATTGATPPRASFHDHCQAAIELVQASPSFITINQFPTVFDSPSWDCHADRGSLRTDMNDIRDVVAPSFDDSFGALLENLEDRGLLESTLVVATGEFGRTPKVNANGGRDHWAGCWSALIAGGGIRGGQIIGASDRTGSEPRSRPVTPQELVSTIFHALGVDDQAIIPGPDGSPVLIYPAEPVREIF